MEITVNPGPSEESSLKQNEWMDPSFASGCNCQASDLFWIFACVLFRSKWRGWPVGFFGKCHFLYIPVTSWLHERLQQAVPSTFQNEGLICVSLIVTETSDHTWNHEILNISILLPSTPLHFLIFFPTVPTNLGGYSIYVMWISPQSTQQHRFC